MSRTSVRCASNSMPHPSRVLNQANKATLRKELNQGHNHQAVNASCFQS